MLIAFALLATEPAPSEEGLNPTGYICIAEAATGFNYSRQRGWHQVNFNTDNSRYIFGPLIDEDAFGSSDWGVYEFPARQGGYISICDPDDLSANWLECGAGAFRFTINTLTQRYTRVSSVSYVTEQLSELMVEHPEVPEAMKEIYRRSLEREQRTETPHDSMVLEMGECSPL